MSTPHVDVDPRRPDTLPTFLSLDEAAAFLRLGRTTVWDCIQRGQLPAVRFGRRLRIPRGALLQLAREQLVSDGTESAPDQQQPVGGGALGHTAEQA